MDVCVCVYLSFDFGKTIVLISPVPGRRDQCTCEEDMLGVGRGFPRSAGGHSFVHAGKFFPVNFFPEEPAESRGRPTKDR